MRFPHVAGRSLDGRNVMLPEELPADRTVAVIAFQQRHQACVDRWISMAEADGVPGSPLDMEAGAMSCVLELPVLSTRWKLGRGFIDGGMAASIRVPRVLARTITIYTDVRAFQLPLGIAGSDEVQVRVVTRSGDVLGRASGEPTTDAWMALAQALRDS